MDMAVKETFAHRWPKYFPGAEWPIVFYYTNDPSRAERVPPVTERVCVIAQLGAVRQGHSLCFEEASLGCAGAKRYFGFCQTLMPGFEYFLSCGIPGKLIGERYKKSPEIVREMIEHAPVFTAPAPYVIFKRWDHLEASDDPEAVIFYAKTDVLSGLFTLSGFDESDVNAVKAPFSAGCGSIVQYPWLEQRADHPHAVLGMFDVSARPWVQRDVLTFAVPMKKFTRMVRNMDDSFLTTSSWQRVRDRLPAAPE
jgi:hypothetical protein